MPLASVYELGEESPVDWTDFMDNASAVMNDRSGLQVLYNGAGIAVCRPSSGEMVYTSFPSTSPGGGLRGFYSDDCFLASWNPTSDLSGASCRTGAFRVNSDLTVRMINDVASPAAISGKDQVYRLFRGQPLVHRFDAVAPASTSNVFTATLSSSGGIGAWTAAGSFTHSDPEGFQVEGCLPDYEVLPGIAIASGVTGSPAQYINRLLRYGQNLPEVMTLEGISNPQTFIVNRFPHDLSGRFACGTTTDPGGIREYQLSAGGSGALLSVPDPITPLVAAGFDTGGGTAYGYANGVLYLVRSSYNSDSTEIGQYLMEDPAGGGRTEVVDGWAATAGVPSFPFYFGPQSVLAATDLPYWVGRDFMTQANNVINWPAGDIGGRPLAARRAFIAR